MNVCCFCDANWPIILFSEDSCKFYPVFPRFPAVQTSFVHFHDGTCDWQPKTVAARCFSGFAVPVKTVKEPVNLQCMDIFICIDNGKNGTAFFLTEPTIIASVVFPSKSTAPFQEIPLTLISLFWASCLWAQIKSLITLWESGNSLLECNAVKVTLLSFDKTAPMG